jgi:hypothetical protein
MIVKHRLFPFRVGDWAECTRVVAVPLDRAEQSRARQLASVTDKCVGVIATHSTRKASDVHIDEIIVIVGS